MVAAEGSKIVGMNEVRSRRASDAGSGAGLAAAAGISRSGARPPLLVACNAVGLMRYHKLWSRF
jgi:hypothetical protein